MTVQWCRNFECRVRASARFRITLSCVGGSLQPPRGHIKSYLYILYPYVLVAGPSKYVSFHRVPSYAEIPTQDVNVDKSGKGSSTTPQHA